MRVSSVRGCLVCGGEVDEVFGGWGEPEPSLCNLHGHQVWGMHITRCTDVLQQGIRCARPEGHDGKHTRFPLAWDSLSGSGREDSRREGEG